MSTLSPYINQQFNGTIWRLEIDEISETIFAEIRNGQEKQVSFSSISLRDGKVNFIELTTPERWLTGIKASFDGVLLLHNYQSATGPVHKGVVAVDAASGETLWSNYNYAFESLTTNGPLLYDTRIQPKKLFLADVKTGATIRAQQPSVYDEAVNNVIAPQMVMPDILPQNMLPQTVFGNSIHYLDHTNLRIVSLHTLQAGVLKQYLYVMDNMGIVYEDLLNTDIQKLQPEAFILHKNRLIYIKNKTKLKVLNL
jgi:hypothetical protein